MSIKLKNRRNRKRKTRKLSLKDGDLIHRPEALRAAVLEVKPKLIALGYLGREWEEYIPELDDDAEVIVSPTLGTNPHGLRKLQQKLGGWERIHFYDEAHPKVYIGKEAAILGSANLSTNAFEGGTVELMVVLRREKCLRGLHEIFEGWKIEAMKKYGSAEEKETQLEELGLQHEKAMRRGALPPSAVETNDGGLADLSPDVIRTIHIVSTGSGDIEVNPETFKEEESLVEDFIDVSPRDCNKQGLKEGQWILRLHVDKSSTPLKRSPFTWLAVGGLLENRALDDLNTTLAVQLSGENSPPPFKIDGKVGAAMRKLVLDKRYKDLRFGERSLSSAQILRKRTEFLEELVQEAKKKLS